MKVNLNQCLDLAWRCTRRRSEAGKWQVTKWRSVCVVQLPSKHRAHPLVNYYSIRFLRWRHLETYFSSETPRCSRSKAHKKIVWLFDWIISRFRRNLWCHQKIFFTDRQTMRREKKYLHTGWKIFFFSSPFIDGAALLVYLRSKHLNKKILCKYRIKNCFCAGETQRATRLIIINLTNVSSDLIFKRRR